MSEKVILECGCEFEEINGKGYWIYCDEHDVEVYDMEPRPLTKYRKSVEDYVN